MIVGVFAAAGVAAAREWMRRLVGSDGGELRTSERGVLASFGDVARRAYGAPGSKGFVVEGAAWEDVPAAAEDVARAGLACAIGLRDDGLVLARGRFGGRALFYARLADGVVAAASSLAPLRRGLRAEIRRERLASVVAVLPEADRTRTLYEGISRVRSAEIVQLTTAGATSEVVHATPSARLTGTPEELAEELRRRIEAVVARAMTGAKRVAVAVSGGLDSSGVLVAAARARGVPPDVLTVDFAEAANDRAYLRALCDDVGVIPLRIPPRSFGDRMRGALVLDASPCALPTTSWMLDIMARARALGADRLLTGDGGDLVFEGDLSGIAAQASRGHVIEATRAALRLQLPYARTRTARVMDAVVRPLVRRRIPRPLRVRWQARAFLKGKPWVTRSVAEWARAAVASQLAADSDAYGTRSDASWLEEAGAGRILDYGDLRSQVENAAGALWHTPYLDPELVDFVRRVPPEHMFHKGFSRGLYREAMRGLLPESLRLRTTKAGIAEAVREAVHGAGGLGAFEDLLRLEKVRSLDLVEPSSLRAHLERGMAGAPANWTALWAPLAVEAFLAEAT